jgi:uncharacterized protein (DUF342 family)
MTQSKRSRKSAKAKQFESTPLDQIVYPPTESNKKRRLKLLEAKKDMGMDFEFESMPSLPTFCSPPDELKDTIRSLQLRISELQTALELERAEVTNLLVDSMFDKSDLIQQKVVYIRSLQNLISEFQTTLEREKAELAQLQVEVNVAEATNNVSRVLI